MHPVGGGPAVVEQAGVGEHEGARADAHDAGAASVCVADGVDELRRGLGADVGAADDDHRVRSGEVVHRPVLRGHEAGRHLGGGFGGADLEVVPGVVDFGAVGAEDLAGDRQLEDGRAGLDRHGHVVLGERFAHRG